MIGSDDSFDFLKDQWCDDPKILFDGVRGELPEWMPENYHSELHAIRSRLQNYSYDDLLKFVTEVHDYWKGVNVTFSAPLEIHQEIIKLAHFQEVVSLGKEAGLALLMGPKHAELVKKGTNYSTQQSEKAQKPRNRIKIDGEKFSITSIIHNLSIKIDELGDRIPARDLWTELFSELDNKHLDPKENNEVITYYKDDDGSRDEIKYSSFKAMVSKTRKS